MVVIPHTMAVCLIYSMQAPGLFVPCLSACKEQGLFTFLQGLRKQAAHTFMLCSRGEFWIVGCFTSTFYKLQSTAPESFFFFFLFPCLSLLQCSLFLFLLYLCPRGRFHLQKTTESQTGLNVKESSSILLQNSSVLSFVSINKNV